MKIFLLMISFSISSYLHSSDKEHKAAIKIMGYWKLKKHQKFLESLEENNQEYLENINKCLKIRHINSMLNAINIDIPEKQQINFQDAAKTWNRLNSPSLSKTLESFTKNHIYYISFEQFLDTLKECCFQLDLYLQNTSAQYCMLFEKERSQHWVSCLSLRYLYSLPTKSFEYTMNESNSLNGLELCQNFVMFDDFSLSGTQLNDFVIDKLANYFSKYSKKSNEIIDVNIVLVIPYMTTKAFKNIKRNIDYIEKKSCNNKLKIKFKIINSKIIPLISQLSLTLDDKKNMNTILGSNSNNLDWPVVFSDWKVPDAMSIPMTFIGSLGYSVDKYDGMLIQECPNHVWILPCFDPPYKK